jgi:hypothetical protein
MRPDQPAPVPGSATQQPNTWLNEVIEAAEKWLATLGDDGRADATKTKPRPKNAEETAKRLAPVQPDAKGAGWYSLTLRGRTVDSDQLEEAFLAPANGPEDAMYAVRDSVQDGDVLRVLVMAGAPADGLYLWVPDRDRTALLRALVERLREVRADGVHEAFARGRLAAVDPCLAEPPGLNAEQRRAFEACVGRGLNLVWGPPGTGKTEVIVRAVEHLVRTGKSVLLVSGTNIAVDNALERVAKRLLKPDEHGVMVRVGTPHVPAVAEDPRLSLPELRRRRLQAKEDERAAVEAEIIQWEADPALQELRRVEERLRGFDPQAYGQVRRRVQNEERLDRAEAEWKAADRARRELDEEVAQAAARLAAAEARWAKTAAQRDALAEMVRLNTELEGYRLAQVRAKGRLVDAERALQGARREATALSDRRRKNKRRRLAERNVEHLTAVVAAARTEMVRRDAVLATAGPVIERQLRHLETTVGELTPDEVNRLDAELMTCRQNLDAAEALKAEVDQRVGRLRAAAERAAAAPRPTDADRELVARADAEGLPELHRRLPALRRNAERATQHIDELTHEHERLVEQLRELGRGAERAILAEAKVVATTLSMLRLKDGVHGRAYDVVIIDEAAASTMPELVYAVSRARTGAVMLGDFLQNAPIVEGMDRSTDPVVRRWLHPDCFAFFGMRGATSHVEGCVALRVQHRFGESINELANMVAYDNMLHTGSDHHSRIVFVDVDGLGEELAMIRDNAGGRGKWWVIGALLARAITQYHVVEQGEEGAGVVTPYRVQKEIIDAMLADTGASAKIEVSTSHGFQGRQFDTIVFDLVEAGDGWVAQGSRDGGGYAFSGLRLFNVGVTRARHNLYLIGNGAALRRPRTSSGPLHAVARLIDRGVIETVAARDVLGMPEPEIREGARFELWEAVQAYAKVVGIYDEDGIPGEIIDRIREARSSVWVWSPWVGRRAEDFLPELRAAADRGVVVRLLVLPTEEVAQPLHPFVRRLQQELQNVVFVSKEHQKLVVIDERLTFIGSMNILSHPGGAAGRREVMALIESAGFAKRLLRHERADEFARPPTCPSCHATMRVAALRGAGAARAWSWWCYNPGPDATPCKRSLPFAKDAAGRNQPRGQPRNRQRNPAANRRGTQARRPRPSA